MQQMQGNPETHSLQEVTPPWAEAAYPAAASHRWFAQQGTCGIHDLSADPRTVLPKTLRLGRQLASTCTTNSHSLVVAAIRLHHLQHITNAPITESRWQYNLAVQLLAACCCCRPGSGNLTPRSTHDVHALCQTDCSRSLPTHCGFTHSAEALSSHCDL